MIKRTVGLAVAILALAGITIFGLQHLSPSRTAEMPSIQVVQSGDVQNVVSTIEATPPHMITN